MSVLVEVLVVLLMVLLLTSHYLVAQVGLRSDRPLVHWDSIAGAANGGLLLRHFRAGRPRVAAAHLHDITGVGLVLLEVGARHVVHATHFPWLQRDAVVVHYHLGLERLVDYVRVGVTRVVHVFVVYQHVLWALERLVHIVNLSV